MARRPRRTHSPKLKAKVALAAIAGDKTIAELAVLPDVHPNQITEWKRQLVDRAADVFGGEPNTPPVDLKVLHAKIGQLALENDFLATRRFARRDWEAQTNDCSRSCATHQHPGQVTQY